MGGGTWLGQSVNSIFLATVIGSGTGTRQNPCQRDSAKDFYRNSWKYEARFSLDLQHWSCQPRAVGAINVEKNCPEAKLTEKI